MQDPLSPSARVYWSEVLGIKYYLCPKSVYDFRFIKGGLPCKVLAVVFHVLSLSQERMLKNIMASIGVLSFSVLEVKTHRVLNQLLFCKEYFASLVCIFGGKGFIQPGLLVEQQKDIFVSLVQKNLANRVAFLKFCALKELEQGDPVVIKEKKQQIWQNLKRWKQLS